MHMGMAMNMDMSINMQMSTMPHEIMSDILFDVFLP